jgi:hypothetical protein
MVELQQSVEMKFWTFVIVFQALDGSNLLTAKRLKRMQKAIGLITRNDDYEDFCLKTMNPTTGESQCAGARSPIKFYFPSMEADGYTATFQDTSSAPYFLPPSVDTTSVETMLGMTLTPADMPMLVFDGLSDTLLQCPIDMGLAATGVPKQKANSNCAIQPGANGCNLCSLAWCKCDSSFTATWDGDWSPTVTPDKDVLTSATHFLYNSTLFRGLLGKGVWCVMCVCGDG